MSSAVVFAYHNVGVRCLKVLLSHGVNIKLVLTHEDNPEENIWFNSVKKLCHEYAIPCISPADPNETSIEAKVNALGVDFLFSFYYRHMLEAPLLAAARHGAFNMHGSLLPKYRGRVPVNWAIINGETETGVSLHVMNLKPDNGAIVDQQAVPILADDTAAEVFDKITVAAEICLDRALPKLLAGTAVFTEQDLRQGAYFGKRTAEDGRIDWKQSALQIHNLVRAVTHPFPGAFSDTVAGRLLLWRSRLIDRSVHRDLEGRIQYRQGSHFLYPFGGGCLQVLEAELAGGPLPESDFSI